MQMNQTSMLLLVVLVAALLFLWMGCGVKCKGHEKEGYKRSCIYADCTLTRTPVDYAFKEGGIASDPHYEVSRGSYYKPLDLGVDFYKYNRELNKRHGVLGQELSQDYAGCGPVYLPPDSKTLFDLANLGDLDLRQDILDEATCKKE